MVPALLLAALLLQDGPAIESVTPLAGGAARSGCWLPLVVKLRSPAAFEGALSASADAGTTCTRPVKLEAGAGAEILLPALVRFTDARVLVTLSRGGVEVARKELGVPLVFLSERDRLVLVDSRLPEADELHGKSTPAPRDGITLRMFRSDASRWEEAAALGVLDAADAAWPSEERSSVALGTWRILGGRVVRSPRDEVPGLARWELVEPKTAGLRTRDAWIDSKRDAALLFASAWAFGILVAGVTAWTRKLGAKGFAAGLLLVSVAFVAAYAGLFPKGDLGVDARQAAWASPEGGALISLHQVRAPGAPREFRMGRLPKPVYGTATEANQGRVDLEESGGGWTVRALTPLDRVAFLTVAPASLVAPTGAGVTVPAAFVELVRRGGDALRIEGRPPAEAHAVDVSSPELVERRVLVLVNARRNP